MKISKKTLANGLRVITAPMKDNPTVTVLVLVEAGSKYESARENGISHFLEHMCWKGTENRPGPVDISRELDSMGSSYNAFTSHEHTGYYAKADARHFKKIFSIVSDVYLHPIFPEGEIEKEKRVIIEEMNMYRDIPQRHVEDLFMKLLYGNSPAGRSILGSKKSVLRLSRGDLARYHLSHYLPESTVLVVAGKVSPVQTLKEAEKTFGKIFPGRKGDKQKIQEGQGKPAALLHYRKTDQVHFMLGVRTCGFFDKKIPALSVLSSVLSGGMSSRLFVKLREEMGIGYYLRANQESFTDHGYFQISAGVDPKRIKEAIRAVLGECRRLCEAEVPNEELAKAKEILISEMKFSLESTEDVCSFFGEQEILKRETETVEQKAAKIRKITAADLQKTAREIFLDRNLNLVLLGPLRREEEFLKMLKF